MNQHITITALFYVPLLLASNRLSASLCSSPF
uniref:Uncharacterized protein n=1 Tax=Nelumbo nucifera TaxID=4432 RepID=A0A822XWK1_NELNU|nr:TPA_asm: hypothetical protein HUJ06_024849 [Nelumbo nucifera]